MTHHAGEPESAMVCFVDLVDLVHSISFVHTDNSALNNIKRFGVWHCVFA
jgi:hypothetical protein